MESFVKDLAQSEEAFQKQFDPSHPSYHNGITTPVPIGGSRIPETMTSVYSQQSKVVQVDYGPEYNKKMELRAQLNDLKKAMSKLCPPVQSAFRLQESAKDKDQDTVSKANQKIEKQLKCMQENVQLLKGAFKSLQETQMKGLYESVVETAGRAGLMKSKQQVFEYGSQVKKLSVSVFGQSNRLLEQIKKIKKTLK